MKRIIIFLFVGIGSALIDIGVLYVLNKNVVWENSLSISIAFICGLIFNYLCHTYFTFEKHATKSNAFKYLIVVLINYVLTLWVIKLQIQFGVDIILAKVITLPIVAAVTFILSNKWVYK
ncbi:MULTISPECIES: GtrA family protein [Glaesserella]|uniref:GtrA family protein n=1 Tax=Glaesserella australis TaxID=2094024 RepID=A0A328BYJ4_9PAST|nr:MULTISPECIES: GtrA family protein [Glaesserella]AUI67105.1 dTDP-glucose-4-keto-6-deoxy-D-glucose reductase [Glaesserella sp. 15-184]RAL18152.1 GtrA family protein [Glaesserella australis]